MLISDLACDGVLLATDYSLINSRSWLSKDTPRFESGEELLNQLLFISYGFTKLLMI